jgi:hypothetical protein
MSEASSDHETLARLHEEIGRETERIADLKNRIRVLDVEVAGWAMPAVPTARALARDPAIGAATVFTIAFAATILLGRILVAVLA